MLFCGRAPWTLKHGHVDNKTLLGKDQAKPIDYPKPDGVLTSINRPVSREVIRVLFDQPGKP